MELLIKKFAILIMKKGKKIERISIRILIENGNYKCPGILEVDIVKQIEMKEKEKKCFR